MHTLKVRVSDDVAAALADFDKEICLDAHLPAIFSDVMDAASADLADLAAFEIDQSTVVGLRAIARRLEAIAAALDAIEPPRRDPDGS